MGFAKSYFKDSFKDLKAEGGVKISLNKIYSFLIKDSEAEVYIHKEIGMEQEVEPRSPTL